MFGTETEDKGSAYSRNAKRSWKNTENREEEVFDRSAETITADSSTKMSKQHRKELRHVDSFINCKNGNMVTMLKRCRKGGKNT